MRNGRPAQAGGRRTVSAFTGLMVVDMDDGFVPFLVPVDAGGFVLRGGLKYCRLAHAVKAGADGHGIGDRFIERERDRSWPRCR